jgi:hypothetical protein
MLASILLLQIVFRWQPGYKYEATHDNPRLKDEALKTCYAVNESLLLTRLADALVSTGPAP